MRRAAGTTILLATLMLFGSCSAGITEDTEPPAEGVVLRIVVDGEVTADWTLADLEDRVMFTELTIDGDTQSGPLLVDVLRASGVVDWESGEVLGSGEGRVFEVTLDVSSSEVDDGWILDVTKQGTLKLASADLARQEWVRDVGEIRFP